MAGIDRFVNADAIARGLSPFQPELSAIAAGKVAMNHIRTLGNDRADFAIETTLSGLGLARHLRDLRATGYRVRLIYLWLPSIDVAIHRVRQRVSLGGHSIPEETIRRRYGRSLSNLLQTYRPLADTWHIYDNAQTDPALIAHGTRDTVRGVNDPSK